MIRVPMAESRKYRILLVDDSQMLLDMYARRIARAGHESLGLQNADGDFVETVAQYKPDLISMDISLNAQRDGFQAVELLRADHRTKRIPVFFLSNQGDEKDIARGKSLGGVGYIVCATTTPAEVVDIYLNYLTGGRAKELLEIPTS